MQTNHQVVITDKNRLEMDSVICVRAFDEESVLLETSLGNIAVEGKDLKIENFEKSSAKILITGSINCVMYLEKRMKKKGRGIIG